MYFNEYYDFQYFNDYFHIVLVVTLNGEIICIVRRKNTSNIDIKLASNEIIILNSRYKVEIQGSSTIILTDISTIEPTIMKYDIDTLITLAKYDPKFKYTTNEVKLTNGAYIIDLHLETIVTTIIKE